MTQRLHKEIERIATGIDGRIGVCVRDVRTGMEVAANADERLPMASVCKVPILVTAYREAEAGRLDLAGRITFDESCRCLGSGLFNAFDAGIEPTVHDLLLMMIVVSDNAATDLILDRLTPGLVTETMRALRLESIRVDRPIRELINDIQKSLDPRLDGMKVGEWDELCEKHPGLKEKGENLDECRRAVNEAATDRDVASAREIARLCAIIARNECACDDSCNAMLDILGEQQLNSRLPRDLPAFTKFPHKTGTLGSGAVVNDAGILFLKDEPVASVAVLSRNVRNPKHETEAAIARIGRAVYDRYVVQAGGL